MTPNQIYALRASNRMEWWEMPDVVNDLLDIGDPIEDGVETGETGRLVVERKLGYDENSERSVSCYAVCFDGQPFALFLAGGRGLLGHDVRLISPEYVRPYLA